MRPGPDVTLDQAQHFHKKQNREWCNIYTIYIYIPSSSPTARKTATIQPRQASWIPYKVLSFHTCAIRNDNSRCVWWTPWRWINMSTETAVPDTKLHVVVRRKITEWQSVIWSYRCCEYEDYVFWDATPCAFVDRYGRFGECHYVLWSWRWKDDVFATCYLFTKLHDVVSLKNVRRGCWWSNRMLERITRCGPSASVISTKC